MDIGMFAGTDRGLASQSRLTFQDLKEERRKVVGPDQRDRNEFASSVTALKSFMGAFGVGDQDPCFPLLGVAHDEFEARLREFESRSRAKANTLVAYRSRLRRWNELARDAANESLTDHRLMADVLTEALSTYRLRHPGASDLSIATAAGMSAQRLNNWKRGLRRPVVMEANIRSARELEKVLGMQPSYAGNWVTG